MMPRRKMMIMTAPKTPAVFYERNVCLICFRRILYLNGFIPAIVIGL